MAGTVTTTAKTHGSVKSVKWEWTATAGGNASATTTAVFEGEILRCVTFPDSGNKPSDNYDVTVLDPNGADLLGGNGANRSSATTQIIHATSGLGAVAGETLNVVVINAGNATAGTVVLYIR